MFLYATKIGIVWREGDLHKLFVYGGKYDFSVIVKGESFEK